MRTVNAFRLFIKTQDRLARTRYRYLDQYSRCEVIAVVVTEAQYEAFAPLLPETCCIRADGIVYRVYSTARCAGSGQQFRDLSGHPLIQMQTFDSLDDAEAWV